MPTQETAIVDNIIASRRSLLIGGGAALAALAMTRPAAAVNTVTAYTDNDILNFALNLEYLEANFYYLAAFGTTIDVANFSFEGRWRPRLPAINGIGAGSGGAAAAVVANRRCQRRACRLQPQGTFHHNAAIVILRGGNCNRRRQARRVFSVEHAWRVHRSCSAHAIDREPGGSSLARCKCCRHTHKVQLQPLHERTQTSSLGAYIFEDVGVTAYKGAAPLITSARLPFGTAASRYPRGGSLPRWS